MSSAKQIAANQANAQRSTGPKSEAGKKISRQNALKHGCCCKVLDVPDEDVEVYQARLSGVSAELNPNNSTVNAILVNMVVRSSLNLDRCFSIQTARVAKLARDAVAEHDEAIARNVEDLLLDLARKQQYKDKKVGPFKTIDHMKVGPQPQPAHAVRRLMRTSVGCNALIQEWERLRAALIEPPAWDHFDLNRTTELLGRDSCFRREAPNELVLAANAIAIHRKLLEQRERDRARREDHVTFLNPHGIPDLPERPKDEWPAIALKSAEAVVELKQLIDDQQALLRGRAQSLLAGEALDRSEVSLRARFDASDEGRLMYRYQAEQQRGVIKIVEMLRKEQKESAKALQQQEVASESEARPVANSGPQGSRNEAKLEASANPDRGTKVIESDEKPTSKRRGVREKGQKNQR